MYERINPIHSCTNIFRFEVVVVVVVVVAAVAAVVVVEVADSRPLQQPQ
jgi:hypothetical protein